MDGPFSLPHVAFQGKNVYRYRGQKPDDSPNITCNNICSCSFSDGNSADQNSICTGVIISMTTKKTLSLIPSLKLSTTQVSGAVVAAIIAASIGLVALGILTYFRTVEPLKTWLVPYAPASQYGGIFLYTKVIWGILWVGLF